jgi:ABC-type nitrate/sulfonate/bicarbonate transport system substrate-binding protein
VTIRVAVPDLISPSYFPAIAAVTLGICAEHELDAEVQLTFPVTRAVSELAAGEFDFLAGAAHAPLVLPEPDDVVRLMALSHGTYWFLVVRPDLPDTLPELAAAGPVRIGAAPGVDRALALILPDHDVPIGTSGVELVPIPRATAGATPSFGVAAAKALADGDVEGFWANGMGAEVATRNGAGKVILDARRSPDARVSGLTFPALMTSRQVQAQWPQRVDAMQHCVQRAQQRLADDPTLAAVAAESVFPPFEASLIATLIERDAPFYDSAITPEMTSALGRLA